MSDSNRAEIKEKIIKRIQSLKLTENNYESLLLVCNLVEHSVRKKDKIDKSVLVCEIFEELFNLSVDDKILLQKAIVFLHNNNEIKKSNFYQLFKNNFLDWFKKLN
jgi:hypothetical protein